MYCWILSSILVFFFTSAEGFNLTCGFSQIEGHFQDDRYQYLQLDYITIEQFDFNLLNYIYKFSRYKTYRFPKHRISFSGSIINTYDRTIKNLEENEFSDALVGFKKLPPKAFVDYFENTVARTFCSLSFDARPLEAVKTNLTNEVYQAILLNAEYCVENYLCRKFDRNRYYKDLLTDQKSVNQILDVGIGQLARWLNNGTTLEAPVDTIYFSMKSITFYEDTVFSKVKDWHVRHYSPNWIILRGFYDVFANFSLNEVSTAVYSNDKLPVEIRNLQLGFEMSLNFTQNTCKFSLVNMTAFNLDEAMKINFRNRKNNSWFGSVVGFVANWNGSKINSTIKKYLEEWLKGIVDDFNWEKYLVQQLNALQLFT